MAIVNEKQSLGMFARMTQSLFGVQEKETMIKSLEITPREADKQGDSVTGSAASGFDTSASTWSPRKSIGVMSNRSSGNNVLDDLETYW